MAQSELGKIMGQINKEDKRQERLGVATALMAARLSNGMDESLRDAAHIIGGIYALADALIEGSKE
jgi:hypothetical protein